MPIRSWEFAVAAVFLVLCAIVGLRIPNNVVPSPVIGLVRFDTAIDFDSADKLISLMEAARRDDRVGGVVLEVLSPGGYATSSESIYYTMLKLREAKPIVVVVDGLAASGGYYMAAAGNRIYAPASAYIGNVGTRGGRPTDPEIAADELSSGPYKLEGGSRFDQIHQLDLVAQVFVKNVVSQRLASPVNPLKMSPEQLGEARIYLGSEALALGLIDGEGGRSEGIQAAADLAGLKDYTVVDLPEFLSMPAPHAVSAPTQGVQSMLASAPAGAILMLDSRIPLPASPLPAGLNHLGSKRGGDNVVTARAGGNAWSDVLRASSLPTSLGGE